LLVVQCEYDEFGLFSPATTLQRRRKEKHLQVVNNNWYYFCHHTTMTSDFNEVSFVEDEEEEQESFSYPTYLDLSMISNPKHANSHNFSPKSEGDLNLSYTLNTLHISSHSRSLMSTPRRDLNHSDSSHNEHSLSSERRKHAKRVNKTNEFIESIMARPLWKDELTHEMKQNIILKRELERQYETKTYVKDRFTGNFRESTEISEERKGLAMKYTEISKRIVSPRTLKKDDSKEFAYFRRFQYHDSVVKDRNYVLALKERQRARKQQAQVNLQQLEEELKRRHEKELERKKKQQERKKRAEVQRHIQVLTNTTASTPRSESSQNKSMSPAQQTTPVKIFYPKPKVAKVNPRIEAEIDRLRNRADLLEKRERLLNPSKLALQAGFKDYKAPKVRFLREQPKIEGPKKKVKYVPTLKQKKISDKPVKEIPVPKVEEPIIEEAPEIVVEEIIEEVEEGIEEPLIVDVIIEEEEEPVAEIYVESAKRKHIMAEIVATERTYVTLLREIFHYYAEPIQKQALLPHDLYQLVFNNLTVILLLNEQFLEELEKTHEQYLKETESGVPCGLIGELFKTRAPTFKLYTSYINNYEQSLQIISEQTEKNKTFRVFRKSVSHKLIEARHNNTDLSSYMILPVQRIPVSTLFYCGTII
jgi:hypothetical protein